MIVFHHTDMDGYGAAACIEQFQNAYAHEMKVCYIPLNYPVTEAILDQVVNADAEYKEDNMIMFVDISFTETNIDLLRVISQEFKVIWIDHHKSSIEAYAEVVDPEYCAFVFGNYCGTVLTYHFLQLVVDLSRKNVITSTAAKLEIANPYMEMLSLIETEDCFEFAGFIANKWDPNADMFDRTVYPEPWLGYIDMWDCWKHPRLSDSLEKMVFYFQNAADIHMESVKGFSVWLEECMESFVAEGRAIFNFITKQNEKIMHGAFEVNINGHKVFAVNTTNRSSMVFGDKINDYEAVCAFNYDGAKKLWTYSFYSNMNNGIDCAALAKELAPGGGGHAHAAGCVLPYVIDFDL